MSLIRRSRFARSRLIDEVLSANDDYLFNESEIIDDAGKALTNLIAKAFQESGLPIEFLDGCQYNIHIEFHGKFPEACMAVKTKHIQEIIAVCEGATE